MSFGQDTWAKIIIRNPIFDYVGNTAMLNYRIVDDTLYTRFTLIDHNFSERWIRVK